MNRTKIETVRNIDGSQGYTCSPITGCLNCTPEGLCGGHFPCWAYKLANGRLKERYLANSNVAEPTISYRVIGDPSIAYNPYQDPFYPRFWESRLYEIRKAPKGAGIFVCDMGDLFGIGIPHAWTKAVMDAIKTRPNCRFYLYTKQYENLPLWSPFPENCYVGVSVTANGDMTRALIALSNIKASVRFISFEPLLGQIGFNDHMSIEGIVDWVIIGAQTKPKVMPRWEWVREIIEAADKANIPVFVKYSLLRGNPLNLRLHELRQEFPKSL